MKRHVLPEGRRTARTIRILEFSPKWNEEDWCRKGHMGYVVSGVMHLDFEKATKKTMKSIDVRKGQGFSIPSGAAHRASCKTTTRVFIVDCSS